MKKIKNSLINFIVDARYYILVIFTIIAVLCLFVSTKVNINYDMTKYLPEASETKIGKNIMEDSFNEFTTSTLNLMFKGLEESKKLETLENIKKIEGVKEVSYEENENFNKEDYTLYIITVNDKEDSNTAKNVYNQIENDYKNYEIYTSGNVSDWNKPVVKTWIIAVAILSAMVILIIMCESYIEPFLFLYSIGLAVFINMGTNIMFSSVSHITNSIAAILQLALSMDYSIMLMNRYSQERRKENDKLKCMKKALGHAFSSIASSSITTIVGLLALIFMSFTIGKDLGFVLAKGVFLSLVSIFLSLPALILLFDKLILKTKKKSFNLNMNHFGKIVYKLRYPALIIFLLLFGASYMLKDGINILYTGTENDMIASVFSENNQIAIIYKNEFEDKIAGEIKKIDNENVNEILGFSNTIGEKLKYNEINDKLKDLSLDVNVDDYILKLIYYNYYNKDNPPKMTINEFVNFINKEILSNKDLAKSVDKETKENINKLANFSDKKKINQKRTTKEMASILNADEETIKDVFVLYYAKSNNTRLTIPELIKFINSDVLTNKKYNSMIGTKEKNSLKRVTPFINENTINMELKAEDLSEMFGLSKENTQNIISLYYMDKENNVSLTLKELLNSVTVLKKNTHYLDNTDLSMISNLKVFIYNEKNINNTKMNQENLKKVFNSINPKLVDTVFTMAKIPEDTLFTPIEFINFTIVNFGHHLNSNELNNLKLLKEIMDNENTKYTATEISNIFNLNKKEVFKLYTLIAKDKGYEFKLSPYTFVNTILSNENLLNGKVTGENLNTLKLVQKIMTSTNEKTTYSSKDISNLLGLKESDTKLIYSLYSSKKNNLKISLNDFVNFTLNNVVTDEKYKDNFNEETLSNLKAVQKVLTSSLNNEKLNTGNIFVYLSSLSKNLDKNLVELVYLYNGSLTDFDKNQKLTLEELVKYLNKDVINNPMYKDFLDTELKDKIKDADNKLKDAKNLVVGENYSRVILNTKFPFEGKETFEFIDKLKNSVNSDGIYIIGDSCMAFEMSKSFNDELNFITILTMIAIFIVVAITFKSIFIPIILVLIIECAVFVTMSYLSLIGSSVYFISLIIVQSILMGATIDYAIVYTTYYLENRKKGKEIKEAIISAYNKSIHTILCSSSILIIVTIIVGKFASMIASKICLTLSKGVLCAAILILFILPAILAIFDKFIVKNKNTK